MEGLGAASRHACTAGRQLRPMLVYPALVPWAARQECRTAAKPAASTQLDLPLRAWLFNLLTWLPALALPLLITLEPAEVHEIVSPLWDQNFAYRYFLQAHLAGDVGNFNRLVRCSHDLLLPSYLSYWSRSDVGQGDWGLVTPDVRVERVVGRRPEWNYGLSAQFMVYLTSNEQPSDEPSAAIVSPTGILSLVWKGQWE